jgi:SAM-dependent MidA family methyltransferase
MRANLALSPQVDDPMRIELPEPPLELKQHSRSLNHRIDAAIDAHGPLKFSEFMRRCLYEPGLGYYSAGLAKLGAGGDFITAPELGRAFGEALARYLIEPLRALGADAEIVELGPGSGALAEQLLDALDGAGVKLARYTLLEVSADLRARQQERLARFGERVRWLERPPHRPWRGILIGNEVVDALPVDLYVRRGDALLETRVGRAETGLRLVETALDPLTETTVVQRLSDNPSAALDEQRGEVNPQLAPWLDAIGGSLVKGAMLLIDYGGSRAELNHPARAAGTLTCHYRHRAHFDPLVLLGLQDLTAQVDFTALAEAGHGAGWEIALYTTQAHFLIGLGIGADLERLDATTQLKRAQEIRRLTHPLEMGERFKFLVLNRGAKLPDLSHLDRSARL